MKVLALDTATPLAGVAVLDVPDGSDESSPRAAVRQERVSTHSETLLQLIDECLRELDLRPADLTGIVCGSGPGSFTGLRIGASTAKGLAYALDLPLVMVSSLAALATQVEEAQGSLVLAALDAFRGQIYARLFAPPEQALPEALRRDSAWDPAALAAQLAPLAARQPLWLVGDGALRYPQLVVPGSQHLPGSSAPPPLGLARLGLLRLRRGEQDDRISATPNYAALSAPEERRLTYYIALGSNLGERHATLRAARVSLATLGTVDAVSPLYQTAPMPQGAPPQPDYLNQVVRLRSALVPEALLDALLALEAQAGRVRDPQEQNAPRTLDLDIVLLGEDGQGVHRSDRLTIPHPRMHQRTFVLAPLLDLAPTLVHPTLQVPLQALYEALLRAHAGRISLDRDPHVV